MSHVTTDDGVKLYYEETGSGTPIVFVHEFAGDCRSWEPQVRHFSRRYRCITYNARGYPPSDVPEDFERYSQARARDDIRCVLDGLQIERAHIVGLSMGAFATGAYGAHPAHYRDFQKASADNAAQILEKGMEHFAATYGHGPTRVQLQNKDPRGFAEYITQFGEHSRVGSANTMRGYQGRRPSIYDLTAEMQAIEVPTLIMLGDEEEPALEANLLMKRCIRTAGLALLPMSGHGINLEEPGLFNLLLDNFLHQVAAGRWMPRDPRAAPASIWGPAGKPAGVK
jgi:pimeloyl-ACP methyl ester carboxylesterase